MIDNIVKCRHNYLHRFNRIGLQETHPSNDVWICRDCPKLFKLVEQKGLKLPDLIKKEGAE